MRKKRAKSGFPSFLIDASKRLRERGLADVEPPPGTVKKTVAACEESLRKLEKPKKRRSK